MFTVALCDDDELIIKRLSHIVQAWARKMDVPVEVYTHLSSESLLEEWCGTRYDLIFLDIDMPGKNGVDAARQIRETDLDAIIVFLTGYDNYVFTGYEVQAYRYLLKPVSDAEIVQLLNDAHRIVLRRRTEYITFNVDGTFIRLAINDILYVESFSHTVNLVTRFSTIKYSKGLYYLESLLSSLGFVRCHRSFLVNVKHITGLKDNFITLTNGSFVPVSRNKVKQIKTTLLHQTI